MSNLIFHPAVYYEIKESYEWYQNQATGLGDDFLLELEEAYQIIAENQIIGYKEHNKNKIRYRNATRQVKYLNYF
jgi:hypothetical protein